MKIIILLKENWSHMDKFQYLKIFRAARANLLEQLGAMRQKMAIFKKGNSVWVGGEGVQHFVCARVCVRVCVCECECVCIFMLRTKTCFDEIDFGKIFCVYQPFLLYLLGSKD